jgi:hypothetical protein
MNVLLVLAAVSVAPLSAEGVFTVSPRPSNPAECSTVPLGDELEIRGTVRYLGDDAGWYDGPALLSSGELTESLLIAYDPGPDVWSVQSDGRPASVEQWAYSPGQAAGVMMAVVHVLPPDVLYCVYDLPVVDFTVLMPGDANRDGLFDSGDLIDVFRAGKYETLDPAGWSAGDFDADNRFSSGDLVVALQTGKYEQPGPSSVPEPSGFALAAVAAILAVRIRPSRPGQAFARRR